MSEHGKSQETHQIIRGIFFMPLKWLFSVINYLEQGNKNIYKHEWYGHQQKNTSGNKNWGKRWPHLRDHENCYLSLCFAPIHDHTYHNRQRSAHESYRSITFICNKTNNMQKGLLYHKNEFYIETVQVDNTRTLKNV